MVVVLTMAEDVPVLPDDAESGPSSPRRVCRDCRWGECRFRTSRVRSYLIAYREAVKCGDDPAEYIRDSIKSSRPTCPPCHKPDPIEPAIHARDKPGDRFWHIDVKLSLERARDVGKLSLDAWNAEKVARWLCERASEESVD